MSGRAATGTVIPGRYALSVGNPGTTVPLGWAWLPLRQLAEMGTGHTPSRSVPEYWGGDVPWMGIRDARAHHGGTIWTTTQMISQAGLENSSARLLPAGTVALSRTASVGYVVQFGSTMATSQDFVTWTCSAALDPLYLMRAIEAEGDNIRSFGEGSTHTTIYFPELKALEIKTPPLSEQRRIVAKIDHLTGRSRRARDELNRVIFLSQIYKQAILTSVLNKSISGKPQDKLGKNVDLITSGSRDWAKYYDRGAGTFVLAGNIRPLKFDPKPKRFVDPPLDSPDTRRSRIRQNDLLITIVGAGTGDLCCVDQGYEDFFVCQSVAIIRLTNPSTAKFISYWFNSNMFGKSQIDKAIYGAARPHLSFDQIKSFYIPRIENEAAEEAVEQIERAFAAIDRLMVEARFARDALDKLDQAILSKAFRGELVPHNPNDEPASVLLDRIRAEHAAAGPTPKRGRRPRGATA